ncbi:hypothetical protein [Solimicrobium silvestre]|uniref:Uncharacterized protein n=1 Tax=Solimicrobium silvestre TaxID=2099400 RepID=A0A2S9GX06_9BURK|nr:hypothetical protein [Solimicrobium silvestre]PRC92255.1 hypothetical protein S2091_2914 [Solimicrobium silvestre]
MNKIETNPVVASAHVGRAFGAMIFSIFGAVWLAAWSLQALPNNYFPLGLIAICALLIFTLAYRRYQQYLPESKALAESPARKRIMRQFNIINAAQWVAILIIVNVLNNMGLSSWAIPTAIFIIGLHFLPLTHIFRNPAHYVTGMAMLLLAVFYPLLMVNGGNNPAGCLGAGLILWVSAVWAVTANSTIAQVRSVQ